MKGVFALILVLAGCAVVPAPENNAAVIVSSAGELGHFTVQIFGDDRVVISRHTGIPGEPGPQRRVIAGAYARALDVVRSNGPAALAAAGPDVPPCLAWGNDIVRADPPLPEFDMFMRECPSPALTRLMAEVLAAVPVTP